METKKLEDLKEYIEKPINVFGELFKIDVNEYTEKKGNLKYLSWSHAWAEVKKKFSMASYSVDQYEGKPYLYDEHLGYMVSTKVNIAGQVLSMHLPVMDGANKAMKATPYEYMTRNGKKTVQAATMFDINKTIMRCLVKNLAMFGLGLYIYSGEDLPENPIDIEALKKEFIELYDKLEQPDAGQQKFRAGLNNQSVEYIQYAINKLKEVNNAK